MSVAGQTWWIVGASEGLGRALAQAMAAEGARLVLSARNAGRLEDLAAGLRDARAVAFDVTDPLASATAAAAAGPVDGVIYCVGLYTPMTAQTWNPDEACAIAEANFIGALRLLGHVVPAMIVRRRGRVVLIGSLAGHRGLPGAIGYGASKAAIMHLAENLHADLHGTGVAVQVVNPGFIETRLTARNSFAMPQIMPPAAAAARVMRAIAGGRFSTSFPAPFAWLFLLGRWLPLGVFHALLRRGSR
ncbi:3-oxoacyl-[acyl-carrier-protein] reductase FabG [mine drainage metagenome]|uniref:3-oxoacyl-[acyl-carrier-protein] reductase FabG n=1 Tax=mine drainage metagenome TaxID=410659 RepID=A0A1J5PFK1_9ZZZZ